MAAKPATPIGLIGRLAAAGEHGVGLAVADDREASPMASAPAAQAVQVVLSGPGAELERDVRGAHVGDHHGDEERVDAVGPW